MLPLLPTILNIILYTTKNCLVWMPVRSREDPFDLFDRRDGHKEGSRVRAYVLKSSSIRTVWKTTRIPDVRKNLTNDCYTGTSEEASKVPRMRPTYQ